MTWKNKEVARQYNKERYEYLKAHNICVKCAQRDAFNGQVYCPECIEKNALSKAKYRASKKGKEKEREYYTEYNKAKKNRYHERKEQGLCITCGKPQCKDSSRFCTEHLLQMRRFWREKRHKLKIENPKTLDELAAQRSEVSRAAVKKTHLTEGWFKYAHAPKPKLLFGRLAR